MTPSSQRAVESRSPFHFPASVEVIDGQLLTWTDADDDAGITHRGGDDLLSEFVQLATAEPDEMADFLTAYGVPELCQHGLPDGHPDRRRSSRWCDPGTLEDGRRYISTGDLRRASRAFVATRRAAGALTLRRSLDEADWSEMLRLSHGWRQWPALNTWQDGRDALALWLTDLLRDCGVAAVARWDRPRLHLTHEADGLLGTLAILLSREIGQGDQYTCDVCDAPVSRVRAPRSGERIYCDKPACRREQQRRNQAAWRARREGKSD